MKFGLTLQHKHLKHLLLELPHFRSTRFRNLFCSRSQPPPPPSAFRFPLQFTSSTLHSYYLNLLNGLRGNNVIRVISRKVTVEFLLLKLDPSFTHRGETRAGRARQLPQEQMIKRAGASTTVGMSLKLSPNFNAKRATNGPRYPTCMCIKWLKVQMSQNLLSQFCSLVL
jgi:hypothetical protein